MQSTLLYAGIICSVLAGGFLITAVAMFIAFRIPTLWKDMGGAMTQKRIEEIREESSNAMMRRNKVNVFEDLEKKAKVKKANTYSLNVSTTTSGLVQGNSDQGTAVLKASSKTINPNFIIEKDIMFVSTTEVI